MIVVFPFSLVDLEQAERCAAWMLEIEGAGGMRGHGFLLVPDDRVMGRGEAERIHKTFSELFDAEGEVLPVQDSWDHWPESPNWMIDRAARHIMGGKREPWLWLEPDAIPLRKDWLKEIAQEYARLPAGKVFLGDRVAVQGVPLHMSGIGVYPPDVIEAGAGTMLNSQEIAWDVRASEQIVSRAQFSDLIEHSWKHGNFPNWEMVEREVDLANAVIFHSSKDGSLIDRLREKRQREKMVPVAIADSSTVEVVGDAPREGRHPTTPETYDIFIKTYPADYDWLVPCLASIQKFCKGYGEIIVVAPDDKAPTGQAERLIVKPEVTNDGYLSQQIFKLYADLESRADYILHVDSDVVFTRPTSLEGFMRDGKVEWLYTPYDKTETPWQPITQKFMKQAVEFEFMRRAPQLIPRWLYPKLRQFCFQTHGQALCDYIVMQPHRDFSEFNAIGAYAYAYHRKEFHWTNTEEETLSVPVARQFRSWDGVAMQRAEVDKILGSTPVPVLAEAADVRRPEIEQQSGEARESKQVTQPKPDIDELKRVALSDSRGGRKPKGRKRRGRSWTKEQRAAARVKRLAYLEKQKAQKKPDKPDFTLENPAPKPTTITTEAAA